MSKMNVAAAVEDYIEFYADHHAEADAFGTAVTPVTVEQVENPFADQFGQDYDDGYCDYLEERAEAASELRYFAFLEAEGYESEDDYYILHRAGHALPFRFFEMSLRAKQEEDARAMSELEWRG